MREFDTYRDEYEKKINEALQFSGQSRDFFTEVKADYLCALMARHFGNDTLQMLDVGCGSGIIHSFLLDRRPTINLTGIDVAADTLQDARTKQPNIRYDTFDGGALPYPDGQFDLACAICVMHHVPSPEWPNFLNQMRRVVRKGGLVVVIEHNPLNPLTLYIVNTCPFDRNATLLRSSELVRLMKGSGMQHIARDYILFTPFKGSFFKTLDRSLAKIPFGAQYVVSGRVA